MGNACCDAVSECAADAACTACVTAKDSDACESSDATHARVNAFLSCRGGPCQTDCIGATSNCTGELTGIVAAKCQTCLEASCCAEVGACHAKKSCWSDCFVNHSETKCHADPDGHALYHALGTCWSASCAKECAAPTYDLVCDGLPAPTPSAGSCVTLSAANACNPITNEGCDTDAGEACDHTATGFGCFPAPNDTPICEACDNQDGPFCEAGHTCLPDGSCGAFCCDNADCGTGKCDTALLKLTHGGVCVKK